MRCVNRRTVLANVGALIGLALAGSAVPAYGQNIGRTTGGPLIAGPQPKMISITIENYSNQPVVVAAVYGNGLPSSDGSHVKLAEGWGKVQPNGRWSRSFPASSDPHLLILDGNFNERAPQGASFTHMYVSDSGFEVGVPLDDPSVLMLRAGQLTTNILRGDAPPNGWAIRRFFRVGSGGTFQIQPN